MKTRIYLSTSALNGQEYEYAQDALKSNWVIPRGPHIDTFEQEIAKMIGV